MSIGYNIENVILIRNCSKLNLSISLLKYRSKVIIILELSISSDHDHNPDHDHDHDHEAWCNCVECDDIDYLHGFINGKPFGIK